MTAATPAVRPTRAHEDIDLSATKPDLQPGHLEPHGASHPARDGREREPGRVLVRVREVGEEPDHLDRIIHRIEQGNNADIIEDTPLFDRTIERISSNLRKMAGDT